MWARRKGLSSQPPEGFGKTWRVGRTLCRGLTECCCVVPEGSPGLLLDTWPWTVTTATPWALPKASALMPLLGLPYLWAFCPWGRNEVGSDPLKIFQWLY